MTDPQTPQSPDDPRKGSAGGDVSGVGSMTGDTSRPPGRVHRVGPAETADAVAILRAGIREDLPAVQAIVSQVDPIQLCAHLAYLADLFGKRAYGGAEEFDEALAAWQRGGNIPLPD